ncbi:ERF family protein [Pseudochelatococcus sp. B33]
MARLRQVSLSALKGWCDMSSAPTNIISAIAKIIGEVGSVEKRGKNDFHRYMYATAADLFHALQPLLAKHGVVIFQNEVGREFIANESAIAVDYDFTIAHSSGEVWPHPIRQTGVAAAKNTKGGFDDKALNKAHTAARKYFLLAMFQVPTGDYDDADADEDKPAANGRGNSGSRQSADQKPQDRQQSSAPRDPSPGEKGVKAAMLYAISLAESEADLADWYKDTKTQEALEVLAPTDKDDVRKAWAAKRAELRAAAYGQEAA